MNKKAYMKASNLMLEEIRSSEKIYLILQKISARKFLSKHGKLKRLSQFNHYSIIVPPNIWQKIEINL